jgi:Family of unknown function (DUF5683)
MRSILRLLLLWFVCFYGWDASAQQPDTLLIQNSVVADSTQGLRGDTSIDKPSFVRRFFSKDYPNPRKAALFSAIIPGAGQVYNKRWWKLPIVYGALGTALYFEIDNIKQYRELRDNYRWLVDEDPDTNPVEEPYTLIDATTMKGYRDQWRRYVEFSSITLGLAYLLQVTDAFVDAHLRSFDVSDDLSLHFQPKINASPGLGATFGAGLSLQIGDNGRRQRKLQSAVLFAVP